MNTSYSPQAAADQAHSKYRNATVQLGLLGLDTAIPTECVWWSCKRPFGASSSVY